MTTSWGKQGPQRINKLSFLFITAGLGICTPEAATKVGVGQGSPDRTNPINSNGMGRSASPESDPR